MPALRSNVFFVYGTLMRGRCRASAWPVRPTRVTAATVQGSLFDLGSYPGFMPNGDARVSGECWWFPDRDLPNVMRTIDQVEACRGRHDDEYARELIDCRLQNGFAQRAWVYCYRRDVSALTPIPANAKGLCAWTGTGELDAAERQATRLGLSEAGALRRPVR
ncbi:MAG: gamma-glutamylcyclotransferase [Planctomycetota bacterium]|jgi:gamma-glutamylcyclotransferase (GGCT)/AIG2-like uncharacterized protein YtfP|nr:gamma-glutamylcyclotransferase [Planctomycetota bacterium]